jgi:hypothetical protein
MKLRSYITICVLSLTTIGLLLTSCKKTETTQDSSSKSAVRMKRISVPTRVFSIAGEVLAFEATGEAGRIDEVLISMRRLQGRLGEFERALVYEYTKDGTVISQQESKMNPDGTLTVKATAGNRYLIFADLGGRFRNSYVVACSLGRARIAAELVPRICNQIFCGDDVFRASELKERIPELKGQPVAGELGDAVIGGFGGEGSVCDQCLHRTEPDGSFLPTKGCSNRVPVDPDPSFPEEVVYVHNPPAFVAPTSDLQIYRLKLDGSEPVNISNNEHFERAPDVHHRTKKIVFTSSNPNNAVFTMDLNGGNRTEIPNTPFARSPKWSRNDESFIVFVQGPGDGDTSIHRVRPDGSDSVEVTRAAEGERIRDVDVVDDNHIIFNREGPGKTFFDIFIKDMRDASPPVNLTNSADRVEGDPVVSHDGRLIAYLSRATTGSQDTEIHVARLTLPSTIEVLHVIRLGAPAGRSLRDLDFSIDDSRIYVSATVLETEGVLYNTQLFSIRLDGTGQIRVTVNDYSDHEPSVVPR